MLLAGTLSTNAIAQTAPAEVPHDVQCFLATALLASSPEKDKKTMGLFASMYFAGQIYGRDPQIDLLAAARAGVPLLTPDNLKALYTSCGQELSSRGKEISAVGEILTKDAAKP